MTRYRPATIRTTQWSITCLPELHPERSLYELVVAPVFRSNGATLWTLGRRGGPDRLCRRDPDPRGLRACRCEQPNLCEWENQLDALQDAMRWAATLEVEGPDGAVSVGDVLDRGKEAP